MTDKLTNLICQLTQIQIRHDEDNKLIDLLAKTVNDYNNSNDTKDLLTELSSKSTDNQDNQKNKLHPLSDKELQKRILNVLESIRWFNDHQKTLEFIKSYKKEY